MSYISKEYKFAFNGMEKDDGVKGEGNSLDFGARIYDSRLGRWMSVDPLYQFASPYLYGANSPIVLKDEDGNWVPGVNSEGQIILKKEKGDDYASLMKFFGGHENAKKYLDPRYYRAILKHKDVAVGRITEVRFNSTNMFSKTLTDAKAGGDMAWGLSDGDNLYDQGFWGDSYNCFYMVNKLIEDGDIGDWREDKYDMGNGDMRGPEMTDAEFRDWLYGWWWWDDSAEETSEKNAKFGETIVTFGNYHAAIYFGADKSGNSYVFSKNGDKLAPTIMPISDFNGGENDYGGGSYGIPREMPDDGSLDPNPDPQVVKGGWYDPENIR